MADKVLTMAGAGDGATCPPCPTSPRTTLVVVKKQRYPHGRRCAVLKKEGEGKGCRCAKWERLSEGQSPRSFKSVSQMCRDAGREYRIGAKVPKTKD